MKQIKMLKSRIDKKEKSIMESIERRFLDYFEYPEIENKPKKSVDTCDLHLDGKQPLLYVDPKKNAHKEITWKEPFDTLEYIKSYDRALWGIVFIVTMIFLFIVYYGWWLA